MTLCFDSVRKQQEPQEQGRPGPVTEEVQGARKKAVFVERRANQDAILQEFSIPKYGILSKPRMQCHNLQYNNDKKKKKWYRAANALDNPFTSNCIASQAAC